MKTCLVTFAGRVQGVGFRYSVKKLAAGFDLIGEIKNLPDGTVEMIIEGDADEIDEFLHEIVVESDLAGLIKEHQIRLTAPLAQKNGFRIVS